MGERAEQRDAGQVHTSEKLNVLVRPGLPLTAEVNAHHLTWGAENVLDGETLFKCMPPLRDRDNLEGLWEGLKVCNQDTTCYQILLGFIRAKFPGGKTLTKCMPPLRVCDILEGLREGLKVCGRATAWPQTGVMLRRGQKGVLGVCRCCIAVTIWSVHGRACRWLPLFIVRAIKIALYRIGSQY